MNAMTMLVETSASAPRPEVSTSCTSTLVRKTHSYLIRGWRVVIKLCLKLILSQTIILCQPRQCA